jgi:hypothetical protein
MRRVTVSAIFALQCGLLGASAALGSVYSSDFEAPTYTSNATIAGQAGWTTIPGNSGSDLVRGADYGGGWGTHGQYLVVNGPNDFAVSPDFTSTGQSTTEVSYDFRPGDSALSSGQSAGLMYLFDNTASQGMMVSLDFRGDGNGTTSSGTIFATYGNPNYTYENTNIPWQYTDNNTSYHIDLLLDSADLTWKLTVDGTAVTSGPYGGAFGTSASTGGEPGQIWFRGGANNNPGGLVAFDNLSVSPVSVPEPASAAVLGASVCGVLLRRRSRR